MIARIGAHVTADADAWGFPNQTWQLSNMDANTCRIQMFTGGVRRFDDSQKVTAADIHTEDRDWRAPRYVEFAENLQRFSNELGGTGYCDSVCFYFVGWGSEVPEYRINERDADYSRSRTRSWDYP